MDLRRQVIGGGLWSSAGLAWWLDFVQVVPNVLKEPVSLRRVSAFWGEMGSGGMGLVLLRGVGASRGAIESLDPRSLTLEVLRLHDLLLLELIAHAHVVQPSMAHRAYAYHSLHENHRPPEYPRNDIFELEHERFIAEITRVQQVRQGGLRRWCHVEVRCMY